LVMGHGDPLPASPKYDDENLGYKYNGYIVGFGGSVRKVGLNIG